VCLFKHAMVSRCVRWQVATLLAALLVTWFGFANGKRKHYTNGWAIKVDGPDSDTKAHAIAKRYGFHKVQQIGSLTGYYHLQHPSSPHRSKRSSEDKTDVLLSDEQVTWATQLHELNRVKRDLHVHHHYRVKRGTHHEDSISKNLQPKFKDPLWEEQWYLDDKRPNMNLDLNVIPTWHEGLSGKGVVVTILDDGMEHNHTDLIKNYDPDASWDINDNDPDPFPRYDPSNENKHGTRCAGEVAAEANNNKCGVGIAFDAKVGGVRMLDGRVTDRVEAESLSLNPQHIDIYSASWGPSDDGQTVEGPGQLAAAAFKNGIEKGRGGKGSIYVWASGNGGRHDDSCNCDGYTASIYTLSISSSSDHGESPWYSEACASTLASTLSSGAHGEKRIVTTDLHDQCTERHTGTSASAPLAAGIIALVLEKNPNLTWRDVQHIVVATANWEPLKHDNDWRSNGIGLHVNEKFGFGLLDTAKMVDMADPKVFKTVPPQKICKGKVFSDVRTIQWDQTLLVDIPSSACIGRPDEIRYLEHVQVVMTITYPRRGDLVIWLTTPMGTRTCLLPVRGDDASDEGFKKWTFMTTHAWGEDPRGIWKIEIKDGGDSRTHRGTLQDWQLVLHGTKEKPNHMTVTHPDQARELPPPITKTTSSAPVAVKKPQTVKITKVTYTFNQKLKPSSSKHGQADKTVLSIRPTSPNGKIEHKVASFQTKKLSAVIPSSNTIAAQNDMNENPFLKLQQTSFEENQFRSYQQPVISPPNAQDTYENAFQQTPLNFYNPIQSVVEPQAAFYALPPPPPPPPPPPSYPTIKTRDTWESISLNSLVQSPNSFYFGEDKMSTPLQIPQKTGAAMLQSSRRSNIYNSRQQAKQRFQGAVRQDPRFWRPFKRRSVETKRWSEREWFDFLTAIRE